MLCDVRTGGNIAPPAPDVKGFSGPAPRPREKRAVSRTPLQFDKIRRMPRPLVWIVGREWRPRAPLRAILLEEGCPARGIETLEEALADLDGRVAPPPRAIVVDLSSGTATRHELARIEEIAGKIAVIAIAGQTEAATFGLAGIAWLEVARRPVALRELAAWARARAGGS